MQDVKTDLNMSAFYKATVTSATKYLVIAALPATLIFIVNWENPAWHAPWALLFWVWLFFFNIGWTYLVNRAVNFMPYIHVRNFINYLNLVLLFYLTGGAQENFWYPAVVFTIGTSTISLIVRGSVRFHALGGLLVYGILYAWDSQTSFADLISHYLPLVLTIGPIYAIFARLAEILRKQYVDVAEVRAKAIEADFQRQQAEASNKAKTMFLAHINHEIRTPLSAISGFTEIMSDQKMTEEQRGDYLEIIKRNVTHLQSLVSDILDFSKIELDKLTIEYANVSLPDELKTIINVSTQKASKKGLKLLCEIDPQTPEWIRTDPTRLRQILFNLLDNAIKFTENGWVNLKVIYLPPSTETNNEGQLKFLIADTGCGIPSIYKQWVFDSFNQLRNASRGSLTGAGLGLTISKSLAKALGGDIKLLESTEGKGSLFEVVIQVHAPDNFQVISSANRMDTNLDGMKVLVADDSEDTQLLLRSILEKAGATVIQARNGREAIERLKESAPDLVIMDLEMPVLNGFETMEEMRRLGVLTPVIAFTAHALQTVHNRALDLGFKDFLTKPITKRKLLSLVQSYRPARGGVA